jgi:hypothetical protein
MYESRNVISDERCFSDPPTPKFLRHPLQRIVVTLSGVSRKWAYEVER